MSTKTVNGKQKGNSFERDVANILSDRFASYTNIEKSFRRNQDSGSFYGGKNSSRMDTYNTEHAIHGDIICPNNFKFCIECKNYKTAPTLNGILTDSVAEWDKWITQSDHDATNSNKLPFLIIKYNRTATFVILNTLLEISPSFKYKDRYGYLLSDILSLSNCLFFN